MNRHRDGYWSDCRVTNAAINGEVGLDPIRHFSRHRTLATMLIYRDERDRTGLNGPWRNIVAATPPEAKGEAETSV
jgi:hypothetical protein